MSQNNEFRDVQLGLFLLMLAHTIAIVVAAILGYILFQFRSIPASALSRVLSVIAIALGSGVLLIGISQWLYVIPMLIWLRRRQKRDVFIGVLIGALLTMLLNGGCFLIYLHP